ncbi:histone-lysine N-methyltransferase SETMAR [Elysia marginata]|uniref:Histone-lysine N-methyltransferase SETMAR n=1 Tax=Elysia marginata TaxID=1093978 RepID=A0AAV4JLN9_9GAST|nr:histone-lysine N-methyltransferase SETMAR [Elysia marginata]
MPDPSHTSEKGDNRLIKVDCSTLPHPSHSPDLAPSDYHIFRPMKQGLRGKHYDDDEVKIAIRTLLKEQQIQFYKAGIRALVKRWNVALERG